MIKKRSIALGTGTLALMFSCQEMNLENTDNCFSTEFVKPQNISGPDSVAVNEEIKFDLSIGVKNGCGSFGQFLTITDSTSVNIETVAAYRGCVCTQAAMEIDTAYTFTPTSAGVYQFNFKTGDAVFETKEVTVTE